MNRNKFTLSEWSGAVGDLGTMLPLAFALIFNNGFPPGRLFFLWGLAYIVTGWYFRVPVSIQPLKAMAVITLASGFAIQDLATASFIYGILLLILSLTGAINWLQRVFSQALIRGVQLGIGLILCQKALQMIWNSGFYLGQEKGFLWMNLAVMTFAVAALVYFQLFKKKPISVIVIVLSIAYSLITDRGPQVTGDGSVGSLVAPMIPHLSFFISAFIYLIIPQLPLTLGNAVFAASDGCRTFWPERAQRTTPTKLCLSIGLADTIIGLFGGFPICHGAGGIAAHHRFGGQTGGTTIIIGSILVLISLVQPLVHLLFFVPVPILGALLLLASWSMIILIGRLEDKPAIAVAVVVGVLSFFTRNLTIALITGYLIERFFITFIKKKIDL